MTVMRVSDSTVIPILRVTPTVDTSGGEVFRVERSSSMSYRVEACATNWIDDRLAAGSITPATARSYRQHLRSLLGAVGDKPVDLLCVDDLRTWMRAMAEMAPATKYARLSAISAWLDWCVREGLIPTNPADRIERPRAPKRQPRPASVDQAKKVVAKASPRARLMILLAWEMGLRRAEIAVIKPQDIDWDDEEGATLLVHGKGRKERLVPLTPGVESNLRAYIDAHRLEDDDWLFPSTRSKSGHLEPQRVGDIMVEAGEAVGLPRMTAHRYRHRAGTDIARSSGIHTAQHLLGHASIGTTQVYAQHELDQVRAALKGRDFSS